MLAPRELLGMEKGPLGSQECTAKAMTEGWCGWYSQGKGKKRARVGDTRYSRCCASA